jgi:NAD(P)-dependent dehydrogenase (short-subunit alcohol dehydrogenase family)
MYNPFTLKGKTIFVTGASSGIGRSTSIECSRMGAKMIITARDKARLNQTFNELEGEGHSQFTTDLNILAGIPEWVYLLPELDGIVHCAGFTKVVPFQFLTQDYSDSIMRVNFTAPVLITQLLLKDKKISRNSSIVFISSISGIYCSYVAGSMYSASKGAINGIVKAIALELAPKNIRVNSICPGMIDTNLLADGVFSEAEVKEDIKKYPLKRYGRPEEVAYAVIYLLSDASKWMTGTNILIDGGFTLL